jgi:hypothetical protein
VAASLGKTAAGALARRLLPRLAEPDFLEDMMLDSADSRDTPDSQPATAEPPRLHVHARAVYRPEPHTAHDREYLLELAEHTGLGGLFLATEHPLPRGTVLHIEIEAAGRNWDFSPLHGHAVVIWRRRWGKPRGMQVVLFEIEGWEQVRPEPLAKPLWLSALPTLA